MNQEQISERLKQAAGGAEYHGAMNAYAVRSIELARSNYPVSNLLAYCKDMGLKVLMEDMATEERYEVSTVLQVHDVIALLMRRYGYDSKLVYRKTAVHYTAPKDEGLVRPSQNGKKYTAPLSIKTLLAVCEVVHCDLIFLKN